MKGGGEGGMGGKRGEGYREGGLTTLYLSYIPQDVKALAENAHALNAFPPPVLSTRKWVFST